MTQGGSQFPNMLYLEFIHFSTTNLKSSALCEIGMEFLLNVTEYTVKRSLSDQPCFSVKMDSKWYRKFHRTKHETASVCASYNSSPLKC